MASVVLHREGTIAWLQMNRPDVHDAVDREMTALMAERVSELTNDGDARVAVLCGNGPSFSTGVDVKALQMDGSSGGGTRTLWGTLEWAETAMHWKG